MTSAQPHRACWCGNTDLTTFSTEYGLCAKCGTLVSLAGLTSEQVHVKDDDRDYYGKRYWLEHQKDDLCFPDIHTRARNDLTERNLHWLRTLLRYRLPPARVLELACAHGSFVALLNQSGYDAFGVELSPWVVEFGRRTFGAPISVGPIENLDLAAGSLDVIAMMDVLEHLTDPVTTVAHCLSLLKPGGLLLIQTPRFREGSEYARMVEANDAFLEMLRPDEHLYLLSEGSVSRLLREVGNLHIQFEPAIFGQYDMFFVASSMPLTELTDSAVDECLLSTPHGRFVLALLDLRRRETELIDRLRQSETDRAAGAEQIETLGRLLQESETDRATRAEQIETLGRLLQESETDRAARAEQIETLGRLLRDSEADRAEMTKAIAGLLAHSSFQLAGRVAGWREVEQLLNWVRKYDAR